MEEKAEAPRQQIREAFAALQKSHAAGPEAQTLNQLKVQLAAAETAVDLAKGRVSAGKAALRIAAREGQPHEQITQEIRSAEDLVELKTILVEILEKEVQSAQAEYETKWRAKVDDFVTQQAQAAQARADAVEGRLIKGLVPLLVQLQAERDAEWLITSRVYASAPAPEIGQ
jgi:hypothetical protein